MLYAPLRTLIYTDSADRTRLAVDQPSTMYASFADPGITEVGLDRGPSARRAARRALASRRPGDASARSAPQCRRGRTGRGALAGRSGSTGRFAVDVPAAAQQRGQDGGQAGGDPAAGRRR